MLLWACGDQGHHGVHGTGREEGGGRREVQGLIIPFKSMPLIRNSLPLHHLVATVPSPRYSQKLVSETSAHEGGISDVSGSITS